MKISTETLAILITRIVNAPPETVFDAWLSRGLLAQWWGPRSGQTDWTTPHVTNDPKVGGKWRICIRSPQGDNYWAGGTYRTLTRPSALSLTFAWEKPDGSHGQARTIDVTFTPSKENTIVSFRIGDYTSAEDRASEIEGWHECLDRLRQHFDTAQSQPSDEQELLNLAGQWSHALEAKDVDGLLKGYEENITLFDCIPPFERKGLASYRANWEACLPCFPNKFRSQRRNVVIFAGQDVAFMHGLHRIVPEAGETSPAGQTWLRVTVCYRKSAGQWVAVHEHVSVPFDPMTGQAAFITNID